MKTRIPRSDYKIMPWKNGLGTTAEIDRVPAGEGPYLWRLSQASVQTDNPFSTFKGFDRWLTVWQGDAIFLNDLKVSKLEPIRFSGDEETFCRLSKGPVQDVGLIFDRSKIEAKMSVVEDGIKLSQADVHYIFDIETGDTMKFDHPAELTVARSLLISIRILIN